MKLCSACQRLIQPGDQYDVKSLDGVTKLFCRQEACQSAMRLTPGQQSGGVKRP